MHFSFILLYAKHHLSTLIEPADYISALNKKAEANKKSICDAKAWFKTNVHVDVTNRFTGRVHSWGNSIYMFELKDTAKLMQDVLQEMNVAVYTREYISVSIQGKENRSRVKPNSPLLTDHGDLCKGIVEFSTRMAWNWRSIFYKIVIKVKDL